MCLEKNRICKPQITQKGVAICEISTSFYPASKKRRAHEMVKKLKKKKKQVQDSLDEVVLKIDFEDSGRSQSPLRHEDMGFPSP